RALSPWPAWAAPPVQARPTQSGGWQMIIEQTRGAVLCLGMAPALDTTYGVERLHAGGLHRPHVALYQAGGKSLNVARAMRTLGSDAYAIAPLHGATGDRVQRLAEAEGIPLRRLPASRETRQCISILDETTLE